MEIFSFDCETWPIRRGLHAPPAVCYGWTRLIEAEVVECGLVTANGETCGDIPSWHSGEITLSSLLRSMLSYALAVGPEKCRIVNANIVFDFAVLAAMDDSLLDLIFDCYDAGIIEDPALREQLIDIALGSLGWSTKRRTAKGTSRKKAYKLDEMSEEYLDIPLDKVSWRTGYAKLANVPLKRWPQGAIDYAILDSKIAGLIWFKQRDRCIEEEGSEDGEVPDSRNQAKYHFGLHLCSVWGIRTDPKAVFSFKTMLVKSRIQLLTVLKEVRVVTGAGSGNCYHDEADEKRSKTGLHTCIACGQTTEPFIRPNGKKNTKAIKSALLALYNAPHLESAPRLTKGGLKLLAADGIDETNILKYLSTKGDDIEDLLASYDEDRKTPDNLNEALELGMLALAKGVDAFDGLALLSWYNGVDKLLGTYMPALEQGTKGPICARYRPLVETGRASCLHPATLIETDVGTFKISDLPEVLKQMNVRVWTHRGRWRPVTKAFVSGRKKLFRVRTAGGYEVQATGDHRLFTDSGWVRVKDLRVGASVVTENQATARRNVCAVFFDREAHLAGAESQVRRLSRSILRIDPALASKVRQAATCLACREMLSSHDRAQTPGERAVHLAGQRRVESGARGALEYGSVGGTLQRQRLLASEEHQASRPAGRGAGASCCVCTQTQRERQVGGVGGFCSRLDRTLDEGCGGSEPLLRETVRGAPRVAGDDALRLSVGSSTRTSIHAGHGSTHLVEHEQVRGKAGYPVSGTGCCAHEAGACRSSGERSLDGGLPGGGEAFCGAGWRLSRVVEQAAGDRPAQGGDHPKHGAASAADAVRHHGEGPGTSVCTCARGPALDEVVEIEACGLETVWDLEVPLDHSYGAQGFFHHNCAQPNLMNLPKAPGVRECYVPREGFSFCSVDYEALELHTLAQVCLELLGESALADALNQGLDPHLLLAVEWLIPGEKLAYDDAKKIRKDETHPRHKEVVKARNLAKVANFGLPGGLGVQKFKDFAKASGLLISIEEAKELKEAWFKQWPEMRRYFKYIQDLLEVGEDDLQHVTVEQVFSERIRGKARYTAACNSYFQGLAADGAKLAVYEIVKACYRSDGSLRGSRLVVFVHDETIMEHPNKSPADRHRRCMEQARIMVECMLKYTPDVRPKAEPAVMPRWYKDAAAKYDENGFLRDWTPDEANA